MFIRYLVLAARVFDNSYLSPLRRAASIITDYNPDQPRGQPDNAGQFVKAGGANVSKHLNSKSTNFRLGKKEYGRVVSAINTLFHVRFAGESEAYIANGNYIYYFEIHEFGNYKFLKKVKIK